MSEREAGAEVLRFGGKNDLFVRVQPVIEVLEEARGCLDWAILDTPHAEDRIEALLADLRRHLAGPVRVQDQLRSDVNPNPRREK